MKRHPGVGEKLILPSGDEYRISELGLSGGAERFTAVRTLDGSLEKFSGVVLGLVWDSVHEHWRYPSAAKK